VGCRNRKTHKDTHTQPVRWYLPAFLFRQ